MRGAIYVRLFADGLLANALSIDEKSALNIALYEHDHTAYLPDRGLWDWEQTWFAETLPSAPARVLVAAAGGGREALVLAESGYEVACLEPNPVLARMCGEAIGGERVHRGTFEELCAAVLEQQPSTLSSLAERRFDAVLIGWGGLAHALTETERMRLLTACARMAPHGPILASFLLRSAPSRLRHSRTRRLGVRLGRAVARWRRVEPGADDCDYTPAIGFTHSFEIAEVERLAARLGRRASWGHMASFPHVSFVPM